MIYLRKTALNLLAAITAWVVGAAAAAAAREPVDWCNSGPYERKDAPWTSLEPDAVMPVLEAHRGRAERRLQRRELVKVSARYAEDVTGVPARVRSGWRYVLVRSGLVGSPLSTISEPLEQSGRIHILGSLSRDRRTLLVSTHELSPPYPTRRLPVIVLVPNTVIRAAARCSSAI